MDKTKWARIETLFHAALKIDLDERRLFLEQECHADDELKQAVESLLEHDKDSADIDQYVPHAAHSLMNADDDLIGTRIGAYQVSDKLGQGGMGTVYLAHRDDDQYRQKVAIKIIRAGSLNDEVKRRFRLERQILANLEHPFIARLLDGGTTDNGLPYLIMEYVEGQSIDDYCNNNQLSLQDRLVLFRKVCSAVFYAHQKLVVHRDLKPSNILVTKDGEPRLLDFGIAKLLENSESSADSLETRQEDRLLTPQYSSPEQIRGETISTATDVYALGIVLYELITGKRPYGSKKTSSYEIQQQVLETDPLRPSYSITQPDKNSYISPDTELSDGRFKWCGMIRPKQLKRQLSGDLDNIVMMSLRKEPEQRYASVSQFSKDIDYYLQNRPVTARPLSWLYRTTRLVQRNLLSSSVSIILLVSVIGFTVATLIQSKQIETERKKAVAIVNFLTGMFSEIEPDRAQGKEILVREVLDKASEQLDNKNHSLANEPVIEAAIRRVIGKIYRDLGVLPDAEKQLDHAVKIHRENELKDQSEYLLSLIDLSGVYHYQFRQSERQKLNLEALSLSRKIYGDNHEITLGIMHNLASVHHMNGNFKEAENLYLEVLKKRQLILGESHQETLSTQMSLGAVYHWSGEFEKAQNQYKNCLDTSRKALGEMHTQTLICMSALGAVLETTGHYKRAEPVISEHIQKARLILGNEHPETLRSMHNLADVYRGLTRYAESETLFLKTLKLRKKALGNDHIETLQTRMKLARLYRLLKRYSEGLTLVEYTVEKQREKLGFEHPTTLIAAQVMADLYRENNQLDKAFELYIKVLAAREKVLGSKHAEIIDTLAGLGLTYVSLGEKSQAENYLLRALKLAQINPEFNSLSLPLLQRTITQF